MNESRSNRTDFLRNEVAYFYRNRNQAKSLVQTGSSDPAAAGSEITRRT
ncbi:hypothetical protein C8N47_104170 [Mangrovibacterium marinum]|uniref:Uncharacterized protein n=1 Tax=Mangrovibacterium marinum TaxID=1639118 RepID=A0A2T5C4A6_9BACT|nr:hypothetical protein C8N47_104170 [Mangrovibacterium marinum]